MRDQESMSGLNAVLYFECICILEEFIVSNCIRAAPEALK